MTILRGRKTVVILVPLIGSRFSGVRVRQADLTGVALEYAGVTESDLSRSLLNGDQFAEAVFFRSRSA